MSEAAENLNCLGINHVLYDNTFFLPAPFNDINAYKWLKENYEPSDNEIWVVTYPKTGTTLTLQICHEIMACYYNKTKSTDHEYYKSNTGKYSSDEWIEIKKSNKDKNIFDQYIEKTKNTKRFWKTHCKLQHLPCKILPKKIIICCRNPKDALISFYHHTLNIGEPFYNFKDSFDTYFTLWITGLVEHNSYFEYYQKYWNFYIKNKKNKQTEIYWLNYEDLAKNEASKRKEIGKLIKFIGVDNVVNSMDDIDNIMKGSSINKMKKQYETETIKDFVRKGIVGDWKNYFNHQQNEIIDALICLYFHGTEFKYYKDLKNRKQYLIKSKL